MSVLSGSVCALSLSLSLRKLYSKQDTIKICKRWMMKSGAYRTALSSACSAAHNSEASFRAGDPTHVYLQLASNMCTHRKTCFVFYGIHDSALGSGVRVQLRGSDHLILSVLLRWLSCSSNPMSDSLASFAFCPNSSLLLHMLPIYFVFWLSILDGISTTGPSQSTTQN